MGWRASVGWVTVVAWAWVGCGGGAPPPGQPAPPAPPATDGPGAAAAPVAEPAPADAEPTTGPPPTTVPDASAAASTPPTPPSATPSGPKDPFLAPTTTPGDDGWEIYQGMPTLTAGTAKDVKPGTATPEAAVAHFYASLIRGDEAYEQVLAPNPSARQQKRLKRKLAEVLTWTFKQVRLERRKQTDEGYWIKIFFEIEYQGKSDSGTDDAGVVQVGGQWFVASVPS